MKLVGGVARPHSHLALAALGDGDAAVPTWTHDGAVGLGEDELGATVLGGTEETYKEN